MNEKFMEVHKSYNHDFMIIKSSIKVSRNLDEYPFIVALTEELSKKIFKDIYYKISDTSFLGSMNMISQNKVSEKKEFVILLEKFFEKYNIYNERDILQVLLSNDQNNIAIGINLKDHLEIMVSGYGNKLEECYDVAYKIEEHISSQVKFAFDDKLGYLSSAISEIGTGLKVSACIHLPALTIIGYIDKLKEAASQIGFSLNCAFEISTNEGSHYYILSNKRTLGVSEEDIRFSIESLLKELVRKEIHARDTLVSSKKIVLENRMLRAYALLKYSKLLAYDESVDAISMVKLGKSFGIFDNVDESILDEVVFKLKDYKLTDKKIYNQIDIDQLRANLVSSIFVK